VFLTHLGVLKIAVRSGWFDGFCGAVIKFCVCEVDSRNKKGSMFVPLHEAPSIDNREAAIV